MTRNEDSVQSLRLAVPKGRMEASVTTLLADAGIHLRAGLRGYRPIASTPGLEVKLLKPQNIVEMLAAGSRDLGFAGADWVAELEADLVEILDTELDPVSVVVAAPGSLLEDGRLPKRTLIVASELARLTLTWIERTGVRAQLVHSYGATEVFPPEDSDLIVDISASGQTLEANGLTVVETLMSSSTRLYASRQAMDDPSKKEPIQALALSLQSVLDARGRAMVELNVFEDDLERIVGILPSMREPTIATLHGGGGYAIKAAVPRSSLTALIPWLKESGATDIVVSSLEQIVP